MKKCLFAIFILSIMDAVLTCTGIEMGIVEEVNPLLQGIFNTAPEIAAFSVIVFVGLMLWIIGRYGYKLPWIKFGLAAIVAVKLYVIYAHLSWIMVAM